MECLKSIISGKGDVLIPGWPFASGACLAVGNWILSDRICRVGSISVSWQVGSLFQGHVLLVQQQWYYKKIHE